MLAAVEAVSMQGIPGTEASEVRIKPNLRRSMAQAEAVECYLTSVSKAQASSA